MNDLSNDPHHKERKKLIDDYYKALPNYPKIGVNAVFEHLQYVWKLMKDKGICPDMPIEHFVQLVQQCQMDTLMDIEMMKGSKPPRETIMCTVRNADEK